MYYIDGSYIMMEPMKSRHEDEMIRVHSILIKRLKQQGFEPKKQILDNEISKAYAKSIKNHGMVRERRYQKKHIDAMLPKRQFKRPRITSKQY
jgi:hypothetical protein